MLEVEKKCFFVTSRLLKLTLNSSFKYSNAWCMWIKRRHSWWMVSIYCSIKVHIFIPIIDLLNIDININIAVFHLYRIDIVSKPKRYGIITNYGQSKLKFPPYSATLTMCFWKWCKPTCNWLQTAMLKFHQNEMHVHCGCGEMPSRLWLIDANLQMHRLTLPPKGSAI